MFVHHALNWNVDSLLKISLFANESSFLIFLWNSLQNFIIDVKAYTSCRLYMSIQICFHKTTTVLSLVFTTHNDLAEVIFMDCIVNFLYFFTWHRETLTTFHGTQITHLFKVVIPLIDHRSKRWLFFSNMCIETLLNCCNTAGFYQHTKWVLCSWFCYFAYRAF